MKEILERPISIEESDVLLFRPEAIEGLFVTRWTSKSRGPGWLVLQEPRETLAAERVADVIPLLEAAEDGASRGEAVAAYVAYEAAPAFDPSLEVVSGPQIPLACARFYAGRPRWHRVLAPTSPQSGVKVSVAVDEAWYRDRFDRIKGFIGNGDAYQVNLTFPLDLELPVDLWSLFVELNGVSPYPYSTFFHTPTAVILSFSPELFFEKAGTSIRSKPMKGTARRSPNRGEDLRNANSLKLSEKEQAENLMVVDMVRNDLGRIAKVGSVHVSSLFHVERFPTVWQMTSEVRATTGGTLRDVFKALFPGASVTGAPKGSAMSIIKELEQGPRGVYTGALGFVAKDYSRFSLPIRTVTVADRARAAVGSGVVWDSDGESEWRECLVKGDYLTTAVEPFALLETMRWIPGEGFGLLAEHLERLMLACLTLGFPFDEEAILRELEAAVRDKGETLRVRLKCAPDGTIVVETALLELPAPELCARIADQPIGEHDPLLRFKTTLRDAYFGGEDLWDVDEVLQVNSAGEATEFMNGNLVIEAAGALLTPDLKCGLLNGTLRSKLVEEGALQVARIPVADVRTADSVYRINSLRGWQRVNLIPE